MEKISDGTCKTCLNELQDDIKKYMKKNNMACNADTESGMGKRCDPDPSVFPSATGYYASAYNSAFAAQPTVFSYSYSGPNVGVLETKVVCSGV